MKRGPKAKDVDDYIARHPGVVAGRMEKVRRTVKRIAKGAGEKISYDIPTITVDGRPLLYFAAFADHLSIYPAPRGNPDFTEELALYAGGKGTMRVPHDEPVPYDLIERIARHHLARIQGAQKGTPVKKRTAAKRGGAKTAIAAQAEKKPGTRGRTRAGSSTAKARRPERA